VVLSVLFVGLGLGLLLWKGNLSFKEIGKAIGQFGLAGVLLGLLGVLAQVFFQIHRMWFLFPKEEGARPHWFKVAYAFSLGQLVNSFLPARAGDVVKVVVIAKEKSGKPVPAAEGAGVVIADKIADVGTLLILLLITGATFFDELKSSLTFSPWIAVIVAAVLIILAVTWRWFSRKKLFSEFREGLRGLASPKVLFFTFLIGLGAWTSEAFVITVLSKQQGFSLSITDAVFVLGILNLMIAVPVSVANVGTFEAAIVFGLGRFGVPMVHGLAIATVHHLLQLSAIALWALGLWLKKNLA